jgi:hypothetical protein
MVEQILTSHIAYDSTPLSCHIFTARHNDETSTVVSSDIHGKYFFIAAAAVNSYVTSFGEITVIRFPVTL